MNIYNSRQMLKNKKIQDVDLCVAYYARVSTDKEEQKVSLKHQKETYDDVISQNKHWRFGGKYIDEAKSGLDASKRPEFQRMIADAKAGKFDMIITKEISRFARNTLDSIKYTRELLFHGVCVWFTEENINTIDEDSEFRLTILAGLAQDESRRISRRVRFGHARSIKNGVVMGNSRIYGYDKMNGKLVINPEEARMVKFIFEQYATGEWSTKTLEKQLYAMGYRNHNGGMINHTVIGHIICNPKYKGYYAGGKVKIVDMFTRKQEFLPPDQWVMYKDDGNSVPAIVDEETWEECNRHFRERGDAIKAHRTSFKKESNVFTGLLICGVDGSKYWLKSRHLRGHEHVRWVCSEKLKHNTGACPSFGVRDEELKRMIIQLLHEVAGNIDSITKAYVDMYKLATSSLTNDDTEHELVEKQIESIKAQDKKILNYNLNGILSDSDFIEMHKKFQEQLKALYKRTEQINANASYKPESNKSLDDVVKLVQKYSKLVDVEDITREVVIGLFEKIIITPTGSNTANLSFVLRNGEGIRDIAYPCVSSESFLFTMTPKRTTTFTRLAPGFDQKTEQFEYTYALVV